jgi:hypothetical protein
MMPENVAITGIATSSLDEAPWNDLSVDLWSVPALYKVFPNLAPRVNLWFQIHPKWHAEKQEWWKWARATQPPIMLQEACPELERSMAYPREEIIKRFGPYFTSSLSWMLALAIATGAKKIGIYGVDMAEGAEYVYQRPCVERLIGFAQGRGIKVYIPEHSALLKSAESYGWDFRNHPKTSTVEERLLDEMSVWRGKSIHFEKLLKQKGWMPEGIQMFTDQARAG